MSDSLFTIDTKGDKQNAVYGRPDQYATPKYRNAGRGYLLGLTRNHRLSKDKKGERGIVSYGIDTATRSRLLTSLRTDNADVETIGLENSTESDDVVQSQLDYVSLGQQYPMKRRRLSGHDVDAPYYRSEEDVSDEPSEEELSGSHKPRSSALTEPQNIVRTRQNNLRDQIKQSSDDVDAWLELADLQEALVIEQNGLPSRGQSQTRLIAKLRMSVLEEALERVQNGAEHVRVLTALMEAGRHLWDAEKQRQQWQKYLQHQPASFELCKLYIDFMQSNARLFTIEEVVAIYLDTLTKPLSSYDKAVNSEYCKIYLLLRATIFLRQSGYTERAIAIWQALLELNLFRPPGLQAVEEMQHFEKFWDSEVARLGEPAAKGWSQEVKKPTTAARDHTPKSIDSLHSWSAAERDACDRDIMPTRTSDVRSDDPYNVVLFDDIKGFLHRTTSTDAETLLLDSFLAFAGLSPLNACSSIAGWSYDPYLMIRNTPEVSLPYTGVPDIMSTFLLVGHPFSVVPVVELPQFANFVRNTLSLIALSRSHLSRLAELSIALISRPDVVAARKLAKKLIKGSPSSFSLYNAYALLEANDGAFEKAEAVWSAAINSASPNDQSAAEALNPSTVELWHSWIWSCMRYSSPPHTIDILANMTGTKLTDPNTITAQEDIELSLKIALFNSSSVDNLHLQVVMTDLLAVYTYLTSNNGLSSAFDVYKSEIAHLAHDHQETPTSHSPHLEHLHQLRARLIYHHITTAAGPFKPSLILSSLSQSATYFPNNSILVSLHTTYEQKYGLMDRLRQLSTTKNSTKTLIQHIATIKSELTRSEESGRTEHSIRFTFLHALAPDSPGHACPALRIWYLGWEIELLDEKLLADTNSLPSPAVFDKKVAKKLKKLSSNAISALHDSLKVCPGVKELYLLALGSKGMFAAMGKEGSRALYDQMLECGIRIRIDISDSGLFS